jgi:VTC domain
MEPMIEDCLAQFTPISLETLNGKAEMLERIDNKYILPAAKLKLALDDLHDAFDILEIKGKRDFGYCTCYFDDAERRGYYDHHQRRRKRCKARVRHYVDAGFSYLEVKLNEQRSMTAKRRMKIEKPLTSLDEGCMGFVKDCFRDSYGDEFDKVLQPVIVIDYQRITLVAKEGGERLTIDTALGFRSAQRDQKAPSDMFIVETKSERGNGIADKIFRSIHVQPTKRVSKYCIGMAVTGQVARANGFLPAIRKLALPVPAQPAFPQLKLPNQFAAPAPLDSAKQWRNSNDAAPLNFLSDFRQHASIARSCGEAHQAARL